MKKHIASIVTGSRIIFALPLLFISTSSAWFYILYLFCGFTDMIDGAIARKTGSTCEFGAKLDTVADLVFVLVCSIRILPLMQIPVWLWAWIIVVAFIKLFNIALGFIRRKKAISIHSTLNKATGIALFLLPLSLTFVETACSVTAVCALATVAAIQELCFVAKGKSVL